MTISACFNNSLEVVKHLNGTLWKEELYEKSSIEVLNWTISSIKIVLLFYLKKYAYLLDFLHYMKIILLY